MYIKINKKIWQKIKKANKQKLLKFGFTYRKIEEYLKLHEDLRKFLGLKNWPDFTTLQKFARRQNIQDLEKTLLQMFELNKKKCKNVGVDATGFSLRNASKHYEKRLGELIRKKDFLKSNIFFDLDSLMILSVKIRKKTRHDLMDIPAMWNKIKHLNFKNVFADKAYDADWFHEMIFESGKNSVIHIKQEAIPIHRTKGVYRKKVKRLTRNSEKGKRSLTETGNSILKRVFGSVIHAKSTTMQKIELLFRMIVYNLERLYKVGKNIFLRLLFIVEIRIFLQNIEKEFVGISYLEA